MQHRHKGVGFSEKSPAFYFKRIKMPTITKRELEDYKKCAMIENTLDYLW